MSRFTVECSNARVEASHLRWVSDMLTWKSMTPRCTSKKWRKRAILNSLNSCLKTDHMRPPQIQCMWMEDQKDRWNPINNMFTAYQQSLDFSMSASGVKLTCGSEWQTFDPCDPVCRVVDCPKCQELQASFQKMFRKLSENIQKDPIPQIRRLRINKSHGSTSHSQSPTKPWPTTTSGAHLLQLVPTLDRALPPENWKDRWSKHLGTGQTWLLHVLQVTPINVMFLFHESKSKASNPDPYPSGSPTWYPVHRR